MFSCQCSVAIWDLRLPKAEKHAYIWMLHWLCLFSTAFSYALKKHTTIHCIDEANESEIYRLLITFTENHFTGSLFVPFSLILLVRWHEHSAFLKAINESRKGQMSEGRKYNISIREKTFISQFPFQFMFCDQSNNND